MNRLSQNLAWVGDMTSTSKFKLIAPVGEISLAWILGFFVCDPNFCLHLETTGEPIFAI